MTDSDGPLVAARVYKELFKSGDGNFDASDVAYALDEAVREVRSQDVHPSRWSTFVHLGI